MTIVIRPMRFEEESLRNGWNAMFDDLVVAVS
jgi:hypothetical protein